MENSPSVKSVAYTYGLLLAAYSILVLVLIYVFNLDQENWVLGVVNTLVSIAIFSAAIKNFKSKNGNFLSLKEALKVGFATAAIAGLVTAIYAYIHYSLVYPEFLDILREKAYMDMAGRGMTDAQIEQAMGITRKTTTPLFFSIITLMSTLFFGFLISLVAGLIMKKENPAQQ